MKNRDFNLFIFVINACFKRYSYGNHNYRTAHIKSKELKETNWEHREHVDL